MERSGWDIEWLRLMFLDFMFVQSFSALTEEEIEGGLLKHTPLIVFGGILITVKVFLLSG